MSKYQTIKSKVEPDRVKKLALKTLVETLEAPAIDLSKCGDPDYFSKLSKSQIHRIKKITLSAKGTISAVEFTPVEATATAAASIAGVQVNNQAKAQAQKEAAKKDTSNALKGGELRIMVTGHNDTGKTDEEEEADDFSKSIEGLRDGKK